MKVRIIDIAKACIVYRHLRLSNPPEINAVIVGKSKVILTDDEAIHTVHDIEGELELSFGSIPIKELLRAPSAADDEELGKFVRTFGSRIEANYVRLLMSISEIGLNPSDYLR